MYVQKVRNVCRAFSNTIEYLNKTGEFEDSRNGKVLVSPEPVCTVTYEPTERVLFSPIRDANPFFHMFEAMWMLGGRENAEVLNYFVSDFSSRFAEDDNNIHGAYGDRWRFHFGFDQLDAVVNKLRKLEHDRQCVIQMWDAHKDRANDLLGKWKDRPCNTTIFLRDNMGSLDLTVCCRSNDMIWGAHGANAVHFSILQEYLAARSDLDIGYMYQISNNAHVYLDVFNKLIGRASPEQLMDDRYSTGIRPMPMFEAPKYIDDDIYMFLANWNQDIDTELSYCNKWFSQALSPAMGALKLYKKKEYKEALTLADTIVAQDWRIACYEWIKRRMK